MFGRLLTPLRARFDVSPRAEFTSQLKGGEEELAPEDFARDVLVELMRSNVDNLKAAEDGTTRIEVRSIVEIHRLSNSREIVVENLINTLASV
jgi:hypothetical protein